MHTETIAAESQTDDRNLPVIKETLVLEYRTYTKEMAAAWMSKPVFYVEGLTFERRSDGWHQVERDGTSHLLMHGNDAAEIAWSATYEARRKALMSAAMMADHIAI